MNNKFIYSIIILVILIISIYIFFPISPSIKYWLDTDGTGFLYIGQLILDGKAPYVDVWDHKPPGIHFIYALANLLGNGRWGIWLLGVISLFVSSLMGFKLISKFYGMFPAIIATIMYLYGFNILRRGADYPEVFVLPLQFAILYLFISSEHKKSFSFKYIVIGFLSALCFILKQTLIGIPLSVLIYWFFVNKSYKDLSTVMVRIAGFCMGFVLGLLPVFSYLFFKGALKSFWNYAVVYNFTYIGTSVLEKLKSINILLRSLAHSFLPVLAIPTWFVSIITLGRRKELDTPEKLPLIYLVLLSLPVEIFLACISGRAFKQYFLPLLPTLMILVGFFFYKVLSFNKTQLLTKEIKESGVFFKIWMVSFITLFIFGYIFMENFNEIQVHSAIYNQYDKKYGLLIDYIEKTTDPDDYICFLGERVTFNSITGRKYPTRFMMEFERYMEEFMDDMRTNKSELIIFNKKPSWGSGTWGEFPPELLEILKPYLDLNHVQVEPLGLDNFDIYRLKQ